MKPSNLSEINKAFTEQAAGFGSDKLHLSKQEYPDYNRLCFLVAFADLRCDLCDGFLCKLTV